MFVSRKRTYLISSLAMASALYAEETPAPRPIVQLKFNAGYSLYQSKTTQEKRLTIANQTPVYATVNKKTQNTLLKRIPAFASTLCLGYENGNWGMKAGYGSSDVLTKPLGVGSAFMFFGKPVARLTFGFWDARVFESASLFSTAAHPIGDIGSFGVMSPDRISGIKLSSDIKTDFGTIKGGVATGSFYYGRKPLNLYSKDIQTTAKDNFWPQFPDFSESEYPSLAVLGYLNIDHDLYLAGVDGHYDRYRLGKNMASNTVSLASLRVSGGVKIKPDTKVIASYETSSFSMRTDFNAPEDGKYVAMNLPISSIFLGGSLSLGDFGIKDILTSSDNFSILSAYGYHTQSASYESNVVGLSTIPSGTPQLTAHSFDLAGVYTFGDKLRHSLSLEFSLHTPAQDKNNIITQRKGGKIDSNSVEVAFSFSSAI